MFPNPPSPKLFGLIHAARVYAPEESNQWLHIVAVHDGNGNITFYKNGTVVTGSDSSVTAANAVAATIVGGEAANPSYAFDGAIDEVRVYNRR